MLVFISLIYFARAKTFTQHYPSSEVLLQEKSRKKLYLTGVSRFNTKPKLGLSFLEENKLIYADLSDTIDKPKSLAIFLKNCNRLDKRLLGDFISRPENLDVLKAFIQLFDFTDVSLCISSLYLAFIDLCDTETCR